MKKGDIVRLKCLDSGYRNTYQVCETYSNDRCNGEDLVMVAWQEPLSHIIKQQILSQDVFEDVPQEENKE